MQQQSLNNIIFGTTENLHAHCVTPEFFYIICLYQKKRKRKKTKLMRDLVSYFVPYAAGTSGGGGGWI
jgi:hypothetical protein